MAISGVPMHVLAQNSAPVHMAAGEVELVLQREPLGLADGAGPPDALSLSQGRWLVQLDGVCGSRDATVLHLAWRRTPAVMGAEMGAETPSPFVALGSAALYGLRRASLETTEPGLTLYVDASAQRASWLAWWAQPGLPLELVIRAQPGMTASSALCIQRVRLLLEA